MPDSVSYIFFSSSPYSICRRDVCVNRLNVDTVPPVVNFRRFKDVVTEVWDCS